MAGLQIKSASKTDGMTYNAMLYCKTNIGGYFFDGFIETDIDTELEITSHPVETGASVADHSYVKPTEITMKIKMSDVHQSLVPGQFTGGWSRSITAYTILRKMQMDRIPVSVLTQFGLFETMLLKRVSVAGTEKTFSGLDAEVMLVELPIARVKTVEISLADQTTIETQAGQYDAEATTPAEDESILSQITGKGKYWGRTE